MRIYPTLHSRKRADGTHLVQLCLYTAGQPRVFKSLEIWVEHRHWNDKGEIGKRNWIRGSHPDHIALNKKIREEVVAYEALAEANPDYTPKQVLNPPSVAEATASADCVYDYWQAHIQINRHAWSYHTITKHESIMSIVRAFAPELKWADLTKAWISRFIAHRKKDGAKPNTIGTNLSKLRAVCRAAVRDEIVPKDPFDGVTLPSETPDRKKMTKDEIALIESAQGLPRSVDLSRSIYLFQLYTGGLRIGELLPLRWENVNWEKRYFVFYKGKRRSGVKVRVQKAITDLAAPYIAQFLHRRDEGKVWVFPVLSDSVMEATPEMVKTATSAVNSGLYKLAARLGMPRFSTHIARHSFADIARKKGVSIYGISKALGHSRIAMTERYMAGFDQEAADDAVDEAFS